MDWRRRAGDHDGRLDLVEHHQDRVVVAFSWLDKGEMRHEWAQALELRDGKIVAIRDYAKPSRARLATRLRAAVN